MVKIIFFAFQPSMEKMQSIKVYEAKSHDNLGKAPYCFMIEC